jgi:tetratricopeptide (TPR) repeat protein
MELWRRDGGAMPKAGGLVMRTDGFRPGAAEEYATAARSLAGRMLRLHRRGDVFAAGYPALNRLFTFVQWRLSRMCRMRANEADPEKCSRLSEMENELADRLDRTNPEWLRVQERMEWIGRQDGMRLTPQEGLKLGLERADFKLATAYARRILTLDPDDVKANFAMGMSCLAERQYGRAEYFLKRAREKNPDEPAILNNLAVVLLRLDRFAEAETNAVRALKAFPTSPEIKETLRRIRQELGRDGRVPPAEK